MSAMKPCRFCGSDKLKVDTKQRKRGYYEFIGRVETVTASVRCGSCHARGPTVSGAVAYNLEKNELPDYFATREELMDMAVERWNMRKTEKPDIPQAKVNASIAKLLDMGKTIDAGLNSQNPETRRVASVAMDLAEALSSLVSETIPKEGS